MDLYYQFAVAGHLSMTVENMRKIISISEFHGWIAYLQIKAENEKG